MTVYLLTTGDGSDGNEWNLEGIYATRELAEKALEKYQTPIVRPDGSSYVRGYVQIEEWGVTQ